MKLTKWFDARRTNPFYEGWYDVRWGGDGDAWSKRLYYRSGHWYGSRSGVGRLWGEYHAFGNDQKFCDMYRGIDPAG